ncbi:MAG TPA: tRNA (adenosine(37)-N6)-threonylcarbamoyltransferase complex dimerization subunit type 1 TsaB [Clostridia bacterium]|nr:tRNA (adenosine(37)-N6)-threonylcarbamoyltransferase complex dimerization subunit type 1 TsaB [Clostridia bacterium]
MIVLGVDTSGKTLSVAVSRDRAMLAEFSLATGYRHALTFQPAVDDLLRRCDLTLADVGLFAVTVGPGSFTGIRIGLSSVETMAYAVGAKTIGVSSLRALARSAGGLSSFTVPVLDARGGRVYSTIYQDGERLIEEKPRSVADLIEALSRNVRSETHILVTGDGVPLMEEAMKLGFVQASELAFQITFAPPCGRFIRASAVSELALDDLEEGMAETDPFLLEAEYVLPSSAERAKHRTHD